MVEGLNKFGVPKRFPKIEHRQNCNQFEDFEKNLHENYIIRQPFLNKNK